MEENNIKPFPKISSFKKNSNFLTYLFKTNNNNLPEINNIISEPEINNIISEPEVKPLIKYRNLKKKLRKKN